MEKLKGSIGYQTCSEFKGVLKKHVFQSAYRFLKAKVRPTEHLYVAAQTHAYMCAYNMAIQTTAEALDSTGTTKCSFNISCSRRQSADFFLCPLT